MTVRSKVVAAVVGCMVMCSCEKVELANDSTDGEASGTVATNVRNVQFVIKGITEEYSTKATIASVGCTDLWVWEGMTLLDHQVSTDADFGTPTIALAYGAHDLTFVASNSKEQSWASGVWQTSKVVDDFATTLSVTVSSGSSNSRQVQLIRRNSRVKFVTTDNVPTTVSKCHLTVHNYKTLAANMSAGGEYTHDATVDVTAYQGKTYSVWVNTLTASLTDEEDCAVMIEFLDASSNVLYKYERTLKQKTNRCITLTGNYFEGASNSVSIENTDFDEVTKQLYE